MKLSVSLPDRDVQTIDDYAKLAGLDSRSAVLQHAIKLVRYEILKQQYLEQFRDYEGSEDEEWANANLGVQLEDEEPWW